MSHFLVKRGLLEQRPTPAPHVVAKNATFKHPTSNLRATIFLVSNIALPSYWKATRYTLADRFDRIYCEDGDFAVSSNSLSGSVSRFNRIFFPIFPHKMIVNNNTNEGAKYTMIHPERDSIESRIAFESVKNGVEPLVDPRARRLCETLNQLGTQMSPPTPATADDSSQTSSSSPPPQKQQQQSGETLNVAVPWHMYHTPYICDRLEKDGWIQEQVAEDVLATRRFMFSIMFGGILLGMFSVSWVISIFSYLFFGW